MLGRDFSAYGLFYNFGKLYASERNIEIFILSITCNNRKKKHDTNVLFSLFFYDLT